MSIRSILICTILIVTLQLFVVVGYPKTISNASEIENELDEMYIYEDNYDENMKNIAEPYMNSRLQCGYLDGDEGAKLYYEKYKVEDAKGNIVISHGYCENLERYHEMIYYFMKNGYNVFGVEHRGHGRSGTLGIADKTQINLKAFNQYVSDFKIFMDEVVMRSNEDKKVLLFAHSMGGAIGAKFLEDYPDYFDGAILNAPMLEVHTGNIPIFLANIIVRFQVLIGNGGKYVLGKEPYTPEYNIDEIGTSSIIRYKYSDDIIANNEEFHRGGGSYNWTLEALKITKEIVKENNASKVKIPVLLFQAEQDFYVKPGGQNKFAENAKKCEIRKIENSRHEIFLERDEIQKPYLKQALDFYNKI